MSDTASMPARIWCDRMDAALCLERSPQPDMAYYRADIFERLAEALAALQIQALQSTVNDPTNEWGAEALAMTQNALNSYREASNVES